MASDGSSDDRELRPRSGHSPHGGISEIQVLNQFDAQGYVHEKGLENCETFHNRPSGDAMTKSEVLGATHLY